MDAKALAKRGGATAASAAGAFTLSHMLQQLSGHALWVPVQLRVAVEVFTTLLGTCVFLLVTSRNQSPAAGATTPATKTGAARRRQLIKAIVWTTGAVALFVVYMWLRAECVISWDSATWKKDNPTERPEFADPENGWIYIPLVFPTQEKAYIDQVGKTNSDGLDGLQWIAQNEVDRLFDWLRVPLRMYLWGTSALFLLVHLSIITCVATAAAYAGARLRE